MYPALPKSGLAAGSQDGYNAVMSPPSPRPAISPGARRFLRVSGVLALLAFLTPAGFVVKYYAFDRAHEEARAQAVSLAKLTASVGVDALALPLAPPAPGNAAAFYVPAIQSYADRRARGEAGLPTPAEVSLLLEGARRRDCRFFAVNAQGQPQFVFHDPDQGGAAVPYRAPQTPHETYRYLSAAAGLAQATANLAVHARLSVPKQALLGRAIVRFGDALGREGATRTHLAVAQDVERIGLRLLLPSRDPALRKYVDSQQAFADQVQAKFAALTRNAPDNLALQARVARGDADPLWRREAVWALGQTLSAPGVMVRRPLETLTAKETLAEVSEHDPEPSVRAAASQTLGMVAQQGAVVQR